MLLLVMLLGGGNSVVQAGQKITDYTQIVSGKKYYIGATTGGTDYYFYVYTNYASTSSGGSAKTNKSEAVVLIFEGSDDQWTIKSENGMYLGLKDTKDNGKVQILESPATWTLSNISDKGLIRLAANDSYSLQKNNSGTQFGSYGNTQTDVWLEAVDVDAVETTVSIDATGITNTDVYVNTAAGTLNATVKDNENNEINDANVTWTSSNPDVATVASDGTVTLVAAGTTIITASFGAVEGQYLASSATYELTVTSSEPYVQPTQFDIALNNAFFGTNYNGSASGITDEKPVTGVKNEVTVTYAGSGNHYINDSQIRFYPNNKLTFEAPEGYDISSIVFTAASSTWAATISASTGTYTDNSKSWSGEASSVVFNGSGSSRCDMAKATVTLVEHVDKQEATITFVKDGATITELAAGMNEMIEVAANCSAPNAQLTFQSSNAEVAEYEDGYVLTYAEGSSVITASFAGNDEYAPATATLTVTVSDTRQEAGIEWSSNSVEIELNAEDYTLPSLTNANNLTVTYFSSNEDVALVDENTGEVFVETSAVGTATITATFEGNDTYKPATASYTINIIDPNAADGSEARPYTVADIIAGVTNTSDVYVKGFIVGSWYNNAFDPDNLVNTNLALADDPNETEGANTIPVALKDAFRPDFGLADGGKAYNVGVAQVLINGDAVKYFSVNGVKELNSIVKVAEQVSISAAGMSTYYTDCALDFTDNENIYAYTVTDGTNKVTYNKVDVVPANTAVVLRSVNEGAASELIPVSESTATASSALTGTLTDIYVTTGYVLNNGSNGVGFYKANPEANDGQGTKIAAHRAYLPATSGAKDFIGVDFDSIATAISAIETETETNNVYDLQGRKVVNPAKGLYIVNGKKVVIK